MDITTLIQIIWTVVVFVLIIAIFAWAYSSASKKGFDEAANSIFDDDQPHTNTTQRKS